MYDLIDQPIGRLCQGSGILLWAMRGWTRALKRRQCPLSTIAPTFCHMRVLPALQDFHAVMGLWNRNGLIKIAIASINTPVVSEDEAMLLALWRHAATGRFGALRETLNLLLEEEAVASVEGAMIEAVAKLAQADIAPLGLSSDPLKELR